MYGSVEYVMIRIKLLLLLLFALFFISMVLLPYLSHTDVVQLKVLFWFFWPKNMKERMQGCYFPSRIRRVAIS